MHVIREPDYEIVIFWPHEPVDGVDLNVDVEIHVAGERYGATVFTVANIASLLKKWRETGESPSSYLRVSDAVVVDQPLSEAVIRRVVTEAYVTGDLAGFAPLGPASP
jgi:hypothetical protein